MKKIFITGITGFCGSWLAEMLLENKPAVEVHGLARWRSPKDNILHILDGIHLHQGDLLDLSSLLKILDEERPDYISHIAAQSYVPYSFDVPYATLEVNVLGSCNLFEAIKILKVRDGYDPIVHVVSSSECYGQVWKEDIPIKETQPFRPASPYAVSKVAEDMLAWQYWLSYGIKTIRTRAFTKTGPRRGEVFVVSNFAKQIAAIEVGRQEPVIHVGNLDSVRTFLDVRDAVRAYWLVFSKCESGEVYNIGGNTTMTVGEMLQKLIDMSSAKDEIEISVDQDRMRPSDVTLQIPCIKKFQDATGWKPEIPFETTLRDTLDYWRDYFK